MRQDIMPKKGLSFFSLLMWMALSPCLWAQETADTHFVVVEKGSPFSIALQRALVPNLDWRCEHFDEHYLAFLGESTGPPPQPGLLGVTQEVFDFQALESGSTTVNFGLYYNGERTQGHDATVLIKDSLPRIPGLAPSLQVEVKNAGVRKAELSLSGLFSDSNYALKSRGYTLIGRNITLWGFVRPASDAGAQALTPWRWSEKVAYGEPGAYHVRIQLNNKTLTELDISLP